MGEGKPNQVPELFMELWHFYRAFTHFVQPRSQDQIHLINLGSSQKGVQFPWTSDRMQCWLNGGGGFSTGIPTEYTPQEEDLLWGNQKQKTEDLFHLMFWKGVLCLKTANALIGVTLNRNTANTLPKNLFSASNFWNIRKLHLQKCWKNFLANSSQKFWSRVWVKGQNLLSLFFSFDDINGKRTYLLAGQWQKQPKCRRRPKIHTSFLFSWTFSFFCPTFFFFYLCSFSQFFSCFRPLRFFLPKSDTHWYTNNCRFFPVFLCLFSLARDLHFWDPYARNRLFTLRETQCFSPLCEKLVFQTSNERKTPTQ